MKSQDKKPHAFWGEGQCRIPIYPNGCFKHSDCFTCPFPDCKLDSSMATYGGLRKEERITRGMQS